MSNVTSVEINGQVVKTVTIITEAALEKSLPELRSQIENGIVGVNIKRAFTFRNGAFRSRAALLKLCSGSSCLIIHLNRFTLSHLSIPKFFDLPNVTFVGIDLRQLKLNWLQSQYGIECGNGLNLRPLAAALLGKPHLSACSLKLIAGEVCGLDLGQSPEDVDFGDWGAITLNQEQIRHATIEVYACFLIGSRLLGTISGSLENCSSDQKNKDDGSSD